METNLSFVIVSNLSVSQLCTFIFKFFVALITWIVLAFFRVSHQLPIIIKLFFTLITFETSYRDMNLHVGCDLMSV